MGLQIVHIENLPKLVYTVQPLQLVQGLHLLHHVQLLLDLLVGQPDGLPDLGGKPLQHEGVDVLLQHGEVQGAEGLLLGPGNHCLLLHLKFKVKLGGGGMLDKTPDFN